MDIKQKIEDAKAAIAAEVAALGGEAPNAAGSWSGDYGIGEDTTGDRWNWRGTGMLKVSLSAGGDTFRARTFKESDKKPLDAAKIAAAIMARRAAKHARSAERDAEEAARKSFRAAIAGRHIDGVAVIVSARAVTVDFKINDPAKIDHILDGLADVIAKVGGL